MAQGPLDLPGEQIAVVAEVAFQRVAVDDDPVLVAFARDAVAEVLAVCMPSAPRSETTTATFASTSWNSSGSRSIASTTSDSNSSSSGESGMLQR